MSRPRKTPDTGTALVAAGFPLKKIAAPLLDWYHKNRRILPFREDPTPYHVWVSEIMLQQTQVKTALPYYLRFIEQLPDVAALAACEDERLHKLWEGLGYYSRVRNMKKAAIAVMEHHGGQLPASYEELLALPGIGSYTAGAIASIAFGLPHVAVDGNVLRVFARLLACEDNILAPATMKALSASVQAAQPADEPGDYNQALMELGALVCLPAKAGCDACPLKVLCEGAHMGIADRLPLREKAKEKQQVDITLLVVKTPEGVLLQQRPAKGLLSGLWQPLLFEEILTKKEAEKRLALLVPGAAITGPLPAARHIFTHKVWQMKGWLCVAPEGALPPGDGFVFATAAQLEEKYTLPGAFKSYLALLASK